MNPPTKSPQTWKAALRRLAQRGARRLRRSHLGLWLSDGSSLPAAQPRKQEIAGHTIVLPSTPMPTTVRGTFLDRFGQSHEVLSGYRDWLKPSWRTMFDPPIQELPAGMRVFSPAVRSKLLTWMDDLLVRCGADWPRPGGQVLEIGCYLGQSSYALAHQTGVRVTAIDLPEYYIQQQPGQRPTPDALARESERLTRLRGQVRASFAQAGVPSETLDRVTFLDTDISQADALPAESFDALVSWEVLEHLRDPAASFQHMARLLKPGGIGYHEYNPFFAIDGGHSLGALDIPYGHVRLNADDYARHLHADRPDEAALDLQFYQYNLNRMTLADLHDHITAAGLEPVAVVPWPFAPDLPHLPPETLEQGRRHFPRLTFLDLIARFVTVVVRKPERQS